ncbi:PAS domain S-box-containing protein [Desulfonatronum zhilinae]|nr:PAS domain S-box-containing protein [Desulfonatronum zhilinae]
MPKRSPAQNGPNPVPGVDLQDIFDNAPIGIFSSTPEGRFISANPALARMYGYDSPDELIEAVTDIATQVYADPEDRKEFIRLLEEHGEVVNHECRFRQRDGAIFWVSRNARAIRDQTGAIIYYQGFTTDISARKQADEGLREQTQRLNSITENMFDLVSITDLEGNYTYLAPSHAVLGYDLDAMIGANVMEHVHPDDYQAVATAFAVFLANREDGRKVEYRYRRADGSYLWFETVGKFIHDEHGNPEKILFSTRDFTARKQAEDALEKRLVALTQPLDSSEWFGFDQLFSIAELQRLQDDFAKATNVAALITHPDGTPITAPTNFCRLCEIIRKTEIGHANCIKSDSELGRMNPGGPVVQTCLSGGLWDAGAAIYVGDRHIANWLIGQVRDEEQDEDKIRAYARTIGVDEDVAAEAFREVPAMSRQQFEQIANALFTLATQLSNSAYQNLQQARFITDRKRAEQALRESEQRLIQEVEQRRYAETYLDTILNAVPDPVFVKDMNHRWIRLNEAFCAFMGRSGEELLGKSDYEFFPREEADVFWEKDKFVFETGECNISEEYFTDLNGVRHAISTKKTLLTMPDTGEKLLVGVIRDITEIKQTETALQKSQSLFKKVFELLPIGLWIADKNGKLMQGNPAGVSIWGMEPKVDHSEYGVFKARRLPSGQEIAPEDWALAHSVNKKVTIIDELLEIDAFDGKKKIILNYTAPVLDEQENVEAAIVVNRDITERYLAEEELRFKNALLEGIMESCHTPIFSLDREYRYTSFNKRHFQGMKALYGVDIKIGQSLYEYQTIEEDKEISRRNLDRALRGESFIDEAFSGNQDLSRVYLEVAHSPIRDEHGQVIGVSIFSRDITDRKRAEDELRESEERFKALHNASFGGITIHDKGIILECNHGLSEISGFSYDELIGMDGLLLIAEKSREVVMSNILAGYEKPYEAFGLRKNGEEYPLRLEARNIPYKGKMVRVVEFRDITEQKRAEEALQESEARFRNLFENVPTVAVQGYAMDGITLFWNRASEGFYGFSPDEAIGKNLVDLIIPADMRQDVIREMKDMSESGIPIPSAELQLKRKDGSHIQVYSSHAIVQKPNQLPEMFCIDIDLTDLKRAEQALIQAKEQAEAANQAKSEFLANMSHEIRTPINGIMGMMQLLETTTLDADQQQYVNLSKSSANRLTRLLSDILDLSRVEAGKMDIFEAEFKVQDVGDSVSDLFKVTARDKGVNLECAIDPDIPAHLLGDEARVRQVVFNLVGNALKFTKQGYVRLEMTSLGTGKDDAFNMLFSISDTGIGIPEDKLDSLFQPFVQVDGSYTRSFQGAGLGLAIVKRLVGLMGGKISMQSVVGEGTTVRVLLPFKLPEGVSIAAEQESGNLAEAKRSLRILLAEDEPSNAMPIMKLLEKAGHTVTLAEDGQQVLDLYQGQDFDVILMDVQMPVLNGVEATRRIRAIEVQGGVHGSRGKVHGSTVGKIAVDGIDVGAHRGAPDGVAQNATHPDDTTAPTVNREPLNREPRIPIIALTAYAMLGDREKFLEAGMDDYLAKPVRMEDLEKALGQGFRHGGGVNA